SVCAEHDFRTIEADTLHLDLHFVGSRWGDIQVFNLQNTWITVLMESNDTCHGRLQPFRSKRRGCYALGEKVCCFRRTHPRSAFVKGLTFNSGSSLLHIQWRGPKIKRDLLATPFQYLCCFFLVYCSVEKLMHQRPNPIHFFFQREMARVEKMELCTGNISFIEFSTLHRKDSIVFAPSDQRGGLLFTEILLPIGIGIQIPFCVVED